MMKTPFSALPFLCLFGPAIILAADIHVSPQGADSADGSQAHPFATLARARDAARLVRQDKPAEPVTVWLAPGDYFFNEPFTLAAADGGTADAPVVYRGSEGGQPSRLIGARHLTFADFTPVTDEATLARIDPSAAGKVVALDLAKLVVVHSKKSPNVFTDGGGLPDLFVGGRRMPLSRFPNEGYMTMKRVLFNAGGPTKAGTTNNDPSWQALTKQKSGGIFEYREEFYAKHTLWRKQLDRGVWIKGYWRIPWQNETVRIGSIDTEQHTVTMAKPIGGGIGNKYTRPAGNGKESYWALNLLEEIDRPGEWAVDFTDQKLYFYPPADLAAQEILLADQDAPVVGMDGASHLTLRNLVVEAALGHGIVVTGGDHVLVAGCTVRNVDRYAIRLDGGKEHVALSNDLYNLGAGGVWLGGGDEINTPRVPAGHQVVNNHIHDFAQIERVYAPGVNAGFTGGGGGGHHPAVGMLVAHNLIHDTPHGGVLYGSWDSIFEYNEIFRFCTVSNDLGGFYCYDQYDRDGGHTFRYNLVHSSGDGDGLYWDNDHRDMHVYGNIVFLNSTGKRGTSFLYKIGTQVKNPQSIDCTNNIAIQSNTGFAFVSALPGQGAIANNVTVMCKKPFDWSIVKDGKANRVTEGYASGPNMAYDADPGFVDIARHDFRLKPDSAIFKDLPGFKPIPVEKIGLFIDEYRKKLPTDDEIDRFSQRTHDVGLGYEILDRK
jgi:hypothetical protein